MKTNLKRINFTKSLHWYFYIAILAIMLGFQTSYIFKYRSMIKQQSLIMLDMEKKLNRYE